VNPCWLVLVTRGLDARVPPELYSVRDLAERESARWRATFRIPQSASSYSPRVQVVHVIESLFPEPWRACPVWVGLIWNSRSFPSLQLELLAADEDDATSWLGSHVPRGVSVAKPGQMQFERGGVTLGVGIVRVKRVLGF
jgi:hypothetical protein